MSVTCSPLILTLAISAFHFSDVMEVIAHVKKVVSEKFNINLETEIIILKNN